MLRSEAEISRMINELKMGILDNNEWRRAILAFEYMLGKICEHQLVGKDMDLKGCVFCQRYFGDKK